MSTEPTLTEKLTKALNGYENASNTPDFILAAFLVACLDGFDDAMNARAMWYRRMDVPGQGSVPFPYQPKNAIDPFEAVPGFDDPDLHRDRKD